MCYTEIFEYIIKYGALKFPLLTLLGGVIRPGFPGRPDGLSLWEGGSLFMQNQNLQIQPNLPTFKLKMTKLHNRKELEPFRKSLRNNSTSAEATLWKMLKNKQVGGYKFRRQHSVGKKVVDFYCPSLQLAIELDGEPHADLINIALDAERDEWLSQHKITVLRYENRWVFEYPEVIKNDILEFGEKRKRDEI